MDNSENILQTTIESVLDFPDIENHKLSSHLKTIYENLESHKGVWTTLITSAVYKINHPEQDIRKHKIEFEGGYSGRSYDTKFITPVLKKNGLPSMAESGWLTRSIEQASVFDKNFTGNIRNILVKKAFLEIIDSIQINPSINNQILEYLVFAGKEVTRKNIIQVRPIKKSDQLHRIEIVRSIKNFINFNYEISGASKIPVIAVYSIYKSLLLYQKKYDNCTLKDLGFHTTSDRTSKSSGDIEIFNSENELIESVEVKMNISIDDHLINIVFEKIKKFNPNYYYIITTNEVNVVEFSEKILEIFNKHGCELVIFNFYEFLEKYLGLIDKNDFLNQFSKIIVNDTELKIIHKEKWRDIVSTWSEE